MPVDDIYLENIDEYVKDERKLVTYKWLSLTLQVHCNTAKQMLYKYLDTERNTKNTTGLNVTYFVSGLTKPNDNCEQAFKCSVVPEEKLESVKSTLDVLTSCHVYSIQMTKLKDSNALYMTDYEKFKENPFELNKYSGIQYERAQPRSADEMSYMTIPMEEEKKPAVRTESNKPAGKKQPQSALQSMFSKADATKKSKETAKADAKKPSKDTTKTHTNKKSGKDTTETKPAVKAEPKESNKTNKKAGGGGMMSFFSKDTGKAAKAPEKSASKPSPKKKSPLKEEPVSKKKQREDDSDEEVINRSKRRRTGQDLFDSDSEDEDMEAEEEAPVPPTPPRQASPEPEVIDSSPEVEEETEDSLPTKTTSKTEESSKSTSGTKRRKKKRKQVNKTYMDDAGFMVTEKVYEEVSTDASECDEPVKKESKKQTTTKSPNKGKKSPKKTSPGKKGGQGAGKQTNLMSFFKKK